MDTKSHSTPKIGVALSSGGLRGVFAHTGFLLALQDKGVTISAVSGCSAGAIAGGIFASGADMKKWSKALINMKQKQFWCPSWAGFIWSLLACKWKGYTGLSATQPALDYCKQQLKVQTFDECKIPFSALAKNIATGEKKVFTQGELAPCIVASAAIPVFYKPVKIDSEYYCDGALIDLAPTDAICCKYDLDILIIHHVAPRSTTNSNLKKIMRQPWTLIAILNMLLYQQRPWYLSTKPLIIRRCPCGCNAVIIVIEPCLPELLWPLTNAGSDIMKKAQQQADELLQPYLDAINQDTNAISRLIKNSLTANN